MAEEESVNTPSGIVIIFGFCVAIYYCFHHSVLLPETNVMSLMNLMVNEHKNLEIKD